MLEAILAKKLEDTKLYVEDVFNTWVYTGTGATQTIINEIALNNTSEWSAYSIREGSSCIGYAVTSDSSGNFYTTGRANDGTVYAVTAKYNSSGVLQWQRKFKQNTSIGYGVAADTSGNVYVTGQANDGVNYLFVAKYDSSGAIQWQRKLREINSIGRAIALDSSGNVYVTGQDSDGSHSYIIIAKYDSSGAIQWQRKLKENNSVGRGIAVDGSGNILITGNATDNTSSYMIVAQYNSSGVLQWQRKLRQSSSAQGNAITVDSSGNAYATGLANDGTNNFSIIVKYNSSGVLQWQRNFKLGNSQGFSIASDSSGNFYVTGEIADGGDTVFVAKYNSSGAIQWQRKLKQGASLGNGIAVDTSGNVLVTGSATATDAILYFFAVKIKADGTTISGTAFLTMVEGNATDSAASATEGAAGATSSTAIATDSAGTATDAAGTSTTSSATQLAVSSQGGMVWLKNRGAEGWHAIFDTNRGPNKILYTGLTNQETTISDAVTSFNTNGFSLGSGAYNGSSATYVGWTFKKAPKFFDIVTGTGGGVYNHSLRSIPGMIIIKSTTSGSFNDWYVVHRSLNGYVLLNSLNGVSGSTPGIGTSGAIVNCTTTTIDVSTFIGSNSFVAYLFAHDAGGFGDDGTESIIKCGAYSAVGSDVSIDLGWEPQYVLIKRTTLNFGGDWNLYDNMRGMIVDGTDRKLTAQDNLAEGTAADYINFTKNGFVAKTDIQNARDYIYLAIRRGLMRKPTDATKVYDTASSGNGFTTKFPIDAAWTKRFTQDGNGQYHSWIAINRLSGPTALRLDQTAGETGTGIYDYLITPSDTFNSDSLTIKYGTQAEETKTSNIHYYFRQAPNFLDIVYYTGTGSSLSVNHKLGVVPEFIIVKSRTTGLNDDWKVYHKDTETNFASLNNNNAFSGGGNFSPTSTSFTAVVDGNVPFTLSQSGVKYIAYLFASCPGVSKVGSYTGNGSSQNIDCGFTNGARFVLVKRTNAAGSWYIWDTRRGINTGTETALMTNSLSPSSATDSIDPFSAGFTVNQVGGIDINVNAATYIYLAIA